MDTDMRHVPVALERVLELLAPVLDTDSGRHPVLVDATTGLGGHSQAVLTRFPAARVIGLDRDPQAVIDATSRLARFGDRVQVQQVRYDQMDGCSTHWASVRSTPCCSTWEFRRCRSTRSTVDSHTRGPRFGHADGYHQRTDRRRSTQRLSAVGLARILWQYGEERFARRIARQIVANRPLRTSDDLVAAVEAAIPAAARRKGSPGQSELSRPSGSRSTPSS